MSKDLATIDGPNSGKGQFLVYEAEDGRVKIDVRLEDETVWQLMADLFQTTKQNIGQHLKNVFSEGGLLGDSVIKKFFTTAADGKRYKTNLCNLDAFLTLNEREILIHAGRISHEMAQDMAEAEYEKFNQKRIREMDRLGSDFDKTVKQLANGKRGKKK